MGEYSGLIIFLWIVGAPTIGLLVLSLRDTRKRSYEANYAPPRRDAQPRTAP